MITLLSVQNRLQPCLAGGGRIAGSAFRSLGHDRFTWRWRQIVATVVFSLFVDASRASVALVYEYAEGFGNASGAARLLRDAGFEVREVSDFGPLNTTGVDLIFLGGFLSEKAGYDGFVRSQRSVLRQFVAAGGVLFQSTTSDQTEITPAYLPEDFSVVRVDDDIEDIFALHPDHPLLAGIPQLGADKRLVLERHLGYPPSLETLTTQRGFCVVLGTDTLGMGAALLEGEYGRGRFLITSLALDRQFRAGQLVAPPTFQVFTAVFLRNLRSYVDTIRNGTAKPVQVSHPADLPTPGSWSIVLLPDTQYYTDRKNPGKPEYFQAQTEWIVQNRAALDVRFVLQLGDLTQNNAPAEWELARLAMSRLDGRVPYAVVAGNHDYGLDGNATDRFTWLSTYFPPALFAAQPTFGGVMEIGKTDNTFHRFEMAGDKWLVMALEWGPRDSVVSWASQVIEAHPDHRVIVLTHAYLYYDDTRYDRTKQGPAQWDNPHSYGTSRDPEGTNDGEELWSKLISRHPNIVLVVNGHVLGDGRGFLSSVGAENRTVHQILVNFQMRSDGGEGYLRILEIMPDQRTTRVRDYSPILKKFLLDTQSNYLFTLEGSRSLGGVKALFAPPQRHVMSSNSTILFAPIADRSAAEFRAFQWTRNGVPVAGATKAELLLADLKTADSAEYAMEAIQSDNSKTSWSSTLEVAPAQSRLANVSARGQIDAPSGELVVGGVVAGAPRSPILVRAIGPGLVQFGVLNYLRDPALAVFGADARLMAENDDWSAQTTAQAVAEAVSQSAASVFPIGSKDSALRIEVPAGSFTARCFSGDGRAGIAVLEIFELSGSDSRSSFGNLSVRGETSGGERVLTLGFAVAGQESRTLLIRGIGPSLEQFGVPGPLKDPIISVYNQFGILVARNDDWGQLAPELAIRGRSARHGAFALPTASRDSAVLLTVAPGAYTIQALGKGGASGAVLIEIYDLK